VTRAPGDQHVGGGPGRWVYGIVRQQGAIIDQLPTANLLFVDSTPLSFGDEILLLALKKANSSSPWQSAPTVSMSAHAWVWVFATRASAYLWGYSGGNRRRRWLGGSLACASGQCQGQRGQPTAVRLGSSSDCGGAAMEEAVAANDCIVVGDEWDCAGCSDSSRGTDLEAAFDSGG